MVRLRRHLFFIAAAPFAVATVVFLARDDVYDTIVCAGMCAVIATVLPYAGAAEALRPHAFRIGRTAAYRIDGEGVHVTAGFESTTLPWSQVTKVERWRRAVVLFTGPRRVLAIPTSALSDAERTRLTELALSRGGTRTDRGRIP